MNSKRAYLWLLILAMALIAASVGTAFAAAQPFGISSLCLGIALGIILAANAMKWSQGQ